MQEIYQYVAMYAPTVLTALGTVINYLSVFKGLKQNADNLMSNPKMVALKKELDATREELALMRSQVNEMVRRQGELINEMSKVVRYESYENGKNDKM